MLIAFYLISIFPACVSLTLNPQCWHTNVHINSICHRFTPIVTKYLDSYFAILAAIVYILKIIINVVNLMVPMCSLTPKNYD